MEGIMSVAFPDADAMTAVGAEMMSVLADVETERKPGEWEESATDDDHHDQGHPPWQILYLRSYHALKDGRSRTQCRKIFPDRQKYHLSA